MAICAEHAGVRYRVGWISLQRGGDVSVGLQGRALVTPDFDVKKFVWSLYNRVRAEYLLPEVGQAMKPLVAPHLTFHSPDNGHRPDAGASEGWMHLTASNKKGKDKPFEAIFPLELMLTQQPEVPWVRFVSKAIDRMEPDKALTQRGQHEDRGVLSFVVPSLACSLGLSVDFVRPGDQTHDDLAALGVAWFDNAPYRIRVSAHARPPQPAATLGWFHES